MKILRKKAIMKTLKALFLTVIVLTVFLTAIGDVYGKESDVSRDIPMVRSIATDVTEKSEDELSSCITHDESVEPQSAFCMSDEPDNNANDALQGSTTAHFYVEPNGRITMLPSSPPVSNSTDETSHDIVECGEISGYESGSRDGPVSPGPDLLFTDIWTDPAPPVGDSSATIYFRLKNQGTATTTTFRNYFYIGSRGPWYADKSGLEAGAIYDYYIDITLPPGTYELTAIADVWDEVTEDDETNNEYSESIMWEGPDLVYIDIYTDPDPPVAGQPVTLNFKLKNQGTMNAVGEFSSNFFVDGVYWAFGVNNGLAAGAVFTWWGNVTLTPGKHHLAAAADVHCQITESDETNNERFENIEWIVADLIVDDIWIDGSSITAGQPFNLDFRIKNNGTVDTGWFHTRVYIDDVYRYYGDDAGLSAGGSHWWRCGNVWLTSGWHTIEVKADYFNNVTETFEENNNRTESFYAYKAQWTILVYLDGDNNLEGYMINHFLQMAEVGSYRHMSIVVQMDRTSGYDTRYGDWTDCKRFFVKTGTTPTAGNALQNLGEVNMGDDQTLINFATWGINRFEADYYLLNPADHGGSWVGCCWDDTSGGDKLTSAELKNALSSIKGELGRNLDVIWWDDCLMNSIEVATQVYPYVDYMAGSETVSWTHTWDYNPIITALRNWPPPTPQELAINIIFLSNP